MVFFIESFNLWYPLLAISLYYQIKALINLKRKIKSVLILKKKKKTRPSQNQIGFILYSVCLDLAYVCENTKI